MIKRYNERFMRNKGCGRGRMVGDLANLPIRAESHVFFGLVAPGLMVIAKAGIQQIG